MVFRRVISVVAAAGLVLVLSPGGAAAQEGDAALTVQQAHPANASVHYFVKLAADGGEGDPIDGATVTATPTRADGTAGQPVTLDPDGEGVYQGSVPLSESGEWTVVFTSTEPEATVTWDQTMPGETFDVNDDGDGSSPVFPLLFAAAFLLTLAGMGVWALMDRRRSEGADAGADTAAEVAADPGIDDEADAHLDDEVGTEAAEAAEAADVDAAGGTRTD